MIVALPGLFSYLFYSGLEVYLTVNIYSDFGISPCRHQQCVAV